VPLARLAARSIGLLLLAALVATIGPARLLAAFRSADGAWLALAAPGFLGFTLVKAVRWFALLRLGGVRYPLGRTLAAYQASAFLAFVTPGRVGDVAKAAYLKRDLGTPWPTGLASTLADRLLDLAALAALAAVAAAVAAPAGAFRAALVAGCVAIACAALASAWPPLQRAALVGLARLPLEGAFSDRLRAAAGRMGDELARLWSKHLAALALLSALAFGSLFAGAFALARGLGLPIDFATTAYVVAASSVVALLPISVSGIGTRDAALVLLLAPHGVPAERALSFSLAYFACSLVFSNGIGAFGWLRDPVDFRAAEAAR
jgi:glycosyltransferase 2 family protein